MNPKRTASSLAPGLIVLVFLAFATLPSSALAAGPPAITAPTFSEVTETSATLQATIDPAASNLKKVHFDYIPLTLYIKDGKQFGEGTLTTALEKIPAEVKGKGDLSAATGEGDLSAATGSGDLLEDSKEVTGLTTTKGTFAVGQEISGAGIPGGTTITALGASSLTLSAAATEDQAPASLQAGSKTITGVVVTSSKGAFAAGQRLEPTKGLPQGGTIESVGEGTLTIDRLPDEAVSAAPLQAGSGLITNLTTTNEGIFAAGQTIGGKGIPPATKIQSVEAAQLQLEFPAVAFEANSGVELRATGAQPFSQPIAGLTPATAYRVRLSVENKDDEVFTGPEATLQSVIPASIFEPCPNDPFRIGEFAPFGHPSALLPDCRAYEQASPVDKDGGNALGTAAQVRAAAEGAGIIFGSSFGIPGGFGAQDYPFFAAIRGSGEADWVTHGLLPPGSAGPKALVLGWLPDFSASFASATLLGDPRHSALFELHADGSRPTQLTPYVAGDGRTYRYSGSSGDGSRVFFEAPVKLPPVEGEPTLSTAKEGPGTSDVYAWDEKTGRLSLASVLNTEAETEAELPKGASAGPFDWTQPRHNNEVFYYTQDLHAVSQDGSAVIFSAIGSGQLYERLNPTAQQSNPGPNGYVEGGRCAEPAKACTIHMSESHRTACAEGPSVDCTGISEPPLVPDPGGSRTAALQFATADGTKTLFTSSEELTDDANTGPKQPPAQISRATVGTKEGTDLKSDLFSAHAIGIAVDSTGRHLYWADHATDFIGRVTLDSEGEIIAAEPEFIDTGKTQAEAFPNKPNESERVVTAHSTPVYVAVGPCAGGAECVYWTNTGPLGESGLKGATNEPIRGGGTIGRAKIDPLTEKPVAIAPSFISGASEPQGIAADASGIYWVNRNGTPSSIGRATLDGGSVNQTYFYETGDGGAYYNGLAKAGSYLYFVEGSQGQGGNNSIARIPAANPEDVSRQERTTIYVGKGAVRAVAVGGPYLYWSMRDPEPGDSITPLHPGIGRVALADFAGGTCQAQNGCESEYSASPAPDGLASDGAFLFWSENGETPPNPGNDLYLYERDKGSNSLRDLTPDGTTPNGAEVQGMLGASEDGAYVYFVANAVLDDAGKAQPGNCHRDPSRALGATLGSCNLYLLHDGSVDFIARLRTIDAGSGSEKASDVLDWAPTPDSLFGSTSYDAKTSRLSSDGKTLIFRSQSQLTGYENHGVPEFYLHRFGSPTLTCVTCNPTGVPPRQAPSLGSSGFPPPAGPIEVVAASGVRFLSSDGQRVFFESSEALAADDLDELRDVYEWEAPGSGSCRREGEAFSSSNDGCIYLLSTGVNEEDANFADASADGSDVFFFTRSQLVGQDTDQLTDIYDARSEGGLASQNPVFAPPCEAEGCKGAIPESLPLPNPPDFSGPGNPKKNRPKPCARKKSKKHRCHGHQKKHHPAPSKSERRSRGSK